VHSAEIEYALGKLDANPPYAWTEADRKVSATMNAYFANVIKRRDPNGETMPTWPKASLDPEKIRCQVIEVDTRSTSFSEEHRYLGAVPLLYSKRGLKAALRAGPSTG